MAVSQRLFDKISPEPMSGCWLWTAGGNLDGYGQVRWPTGASDAPKIHAHRAVYQEVVGLIPDGLTLDHLCRNRRCVNPAHMEPVTGRENTLRGEGPSAMNARKTHCPRGHALAGSNLHQKPDGRRVCISCRTEWKRRNYHRRADRQPRRLAA